MPKNNKKKPSTNKKKVEKQNVGTTEEIKEVKEETAKVEEVSNNNEEKETKKGSKEVKEPKKVKAKKENKKDSKKDKSNKKSWFKEFKAELKKVVWPKGKELFSNTAVVIVMVLIISAVIFVLDLAFDFLTKFEVEQVKKVQNSITTNETVDNAENQNAVNETENTSNETTETNLVVTENNVEE